MILINEIVTPFNLKKEIDVNMFNFLIKSSIEKQNDYVMIFAKYGDNDSLTTLEKKQLISSINSKYISKIIYYFFLENEYKDLEVINYLNNSDILYVMIQPPRNNFYSQNGLFLYIKNTIKKLKNKKIILVNSSSQNDVSFYFQTIKKLLKICPNIVALYENSEDSSLINLLQKHFNLDILINEKSLSFGLKNNAKGIISLTSYIFSDEFKNIFDDYKNGYINDKAIEYIKFINEILCFSENSVIMKTYLKKISYNSMEVRLPLYLENDDNTNLELLLP